MGLTILAVTAAILSGAAVSHLTYNMTYDATSEININIYNKSQLSDPKIAASIKASKQDDSVLNIILDDTELVPKSQKNSKPVTQPAKVFGQSVQADITALIAAKKSVAQTAPVQRQAGGKSDAAIGKILSANNLRPDKLNTDIYKTVAKGVAGNSIPNTSGGAADNVTVSVMKTISQNIGRGASGQTMQTIQDELNKNKMLADKELIYQQKRLRLAIQQKQEYEQQVAVIDKIIADGAVPWAKNMVAYKDNQRRIGDLNKIIAESQNAIAAFTGKNNNISSSTIVPSGVPTDTRSQLPVNTPNTSVSSPKVTPPTLPNRNAYIPPTLPNSPNTSPKATPPAPNTSKTSPKVTPPTPNTSSTSPKVTPPTLPNPNSSLTDPFGKLRGVKPTESPKRP